MNPDQSPLASIDQYLERFPEGVRGQLQLLRETIQRAAPTATEKISYQMPTFDLHGNLVHFAAYEHHIGFYPAPSGIAQFQQELARWKNSKGAVQFPLGEPLPLELISRIVEFRAGENLARKQAKKKR